MTTAQKERIEYLRGQGDSYAAIAADLGMSENTVKSYCRRNNINLAIKPKQSLATNTCANCGCSLNQKPGSKQKRFCSNKCRMVWWATHPEAMNRKAVYHFVCPTCGAEFESYGNARRQYCSRACFGLSRRTCNE